MKFGSLSSMVQEVLASSESLLKVAEAEEYSEETKKEEKKAKDEETKEASLESFLKVAESCEFLADHLHEVVDSRTPHEKLAEYAEVHEALMKAAEGDIPMDPQLDSGIGPGGPESAMVAEEATTTGDSLGAGESGEATPAHQSPKVTAPTEATTAAGPANAMETNEEMMMGEQPEDVLKQAGVPATFAKYFVKAAADAENPAAISAGTVPELQSVADANPAQMQGSEVGEQTPRETAPTTGEGAGRALIASNEAAIAATKGKAKAPVKAPLAEVLTEPAMAVAHDTVLAQSLDNTSSAGVKIAAARALIKKVAESSPDAMQKIAYLVKLAEGEMVTPEEQAAVGEVSPEEILAAQAIAEAEKAQAEEEAKQSMMAGGAPAAAPAAPMAPPMTGGVPAAAPAPAAAPVQAPPATM